MIVAKQMSSKDSEKDREDTEKGKDEKILKGLDDLAQEEETPKQDCAIF